MPRACFITTKAVPACEEITIDYSNGFWETQLGLHAAAAANTTSVKPPADKSKSKTEMKQEGKGMARGFLDGKTESDQAEKKRRAAAAARRQQEVERAAAEACGGGEASASDATAAAGCPAAGARVWLALPHVLRRGGVAADCVAG